jgi:hypothetical protein
VGLGFLVRLCFALHSFAVWCVSAIAPSFISGWRAFSSVSLCNSIYYTNAITARADLFGIVHCGIVHCGIVHCGTYCASVGWMTETSVMRAPPGITSLATTVALIAPRLHVSLPLCLRLPQHRLDRGRDSCKATIWF